MFMIKLNIMQKPPMNSAELSHIRNNVDIFSSCHFNTGILSIEAGCYDGVIQQSLCNYIHRVS